MTDAARRVLEDRALALARDHAHRIVNSSSTNTDAMDAAQALATTADYVAQDDYTDPAVQRMIEHVRRLDG